MGDCLPRLKGLALDDLRKSHNFYLFKALLIFPSIILLVPEFQFEQPLNTKTPSPSDGDIYVGCQMKQVKKFSSPFGPAEDRTRDPVCEANALPRRHKSRPIPQGTYFHLLVGIGALESCGTREWLVFSWHL